MDTLYIETSIVSYLRQRPSGHVVMAARQLLTHQWWNNERLKYELVTSQYVIDEATVGDPTFRCCRPRLKYQRSPKRSFPERFCLRKRSLTRCISPLWPIIGYNIY
jgi:hypothetical protein